MKKDFRKYVKPGKNNIVVVYCAYLLSIFFSIISLIGLYFSYANKGDSDPVLRSHYQLALGTFAFIGAGWLGSYISRGSVFEPLIHIVIFIIIMLRSVIALQYLSEGNQHPNPKTLWIK